MERQKNPLCANARLEEGEWLNTKDLARIFKKSTSFWEKLRSVSNEGPRYYKIGGRVRYHKPDVMEWLHAASVEGGQHD